MARLSRIERAEVWRQRMDRYLASGQTVAAFCKAEGVSTPSFYQWKRRLLSHPDKSPQPGRNGRGGRRKNSSPPSSPSTAQFTELIVTGEQDAAQAQLPNGVSISLGREPSIVATIVDRLIAYHPATATTGPRSRSRSSC